MLMVKTVSSSHRIESIHVENNTGSYPWIFLCFPIGRLPVDLDRLFHQMISRGIPNRRTKAEDRRGVSLSLPPSPTPSEPCRCLCLCLCLCLRTTNYSTPSRDTHSHSVNSTLSMNF